MSNKFIAAGIAITQKTTEAKRLELTFSDDRGRLQTVSITSAIAAALSELILNFSLVSPSNELAATKMPKEFAVGVGRHERVVLIRFEDDPAYGLEIGQATQLGRVLIEQAEIISSRPLALRQVIRSFPLVRLSPSRLHMMAARLSLSSSKSTISSGSSGGNTLSL